MEYSLLDLLQMQKINFIHLLVIHGNRVFEELHHPLNMSITQRQLHLETHCLLLYLCICLHCQKIVYIQSSFMQGKKLMTPKLHPSYVIATSWSPWPKPCVENHYCPARGLYYSGIHKTRAHGGSGCLPMAMGTSLWRSLSQHSLDGV